MKGAWALLVLLASMVACGSKANGWPEHRWANDWRRRWYRPAEWSAPPLQASLPSTLRGLKVMQAGSQVWAYGIPDHPALDLALGPQPDSSPFWQGVTVDPPRGNALWKDLPRLLYLQAGKGQWVRQGQYRPWLDTHGPLEALEALEDGTFAVLAQRWFTEGEQASPCARYALDKDGELRYQGLLKPMGDVALPRSKPASSETATPWAAWRNHSFFVPGGKALILMAGSWERMTLLALQDGRPLHVQELPVSPSGQRLVAPVLLPVADGTVFLTGAWKVDARDVVRSPGGELAAARLHLPVVTPQVLPVAFRLDPGGTAWKAEPLPADAVRAQSLPDFRSRGRFTVGPDGKLKRDPLMR